MTVTASTTRNDYTAGSAQNVYSYTFQLNEATDVDVYLDGVLQTLNTHYTVQNVGNSTGGTITFTLVDADNNPIYPTEGAVINILMAMDLDRDTAYQPSGAFLAADVNNDFDRLWLASNQQQTEINRTLRLQDTDITTANMELPQNSTRRNKLLGFNNDGNPVAVTNNQSNWDVAYDNMIVSTSFTDGNYTLTQQDGGTFTNSFDGRYFQNTGGNIYGGIDVNGAITSTGNLNITGTITASGYNNTNWDSAYNKKITSVDYSVGTNTLTLEQQDGNSLTTTISGISDIALSYNGAVKAEAVATGIDVTGTATMDGLTVDGNGTVNGDFTLSDANPSLYLVDTTNPNTYRLYNVDGTIRYQTDINSEFGNSRHEFWVDGKKYLRIVAGGDISFFEDTGTTPKFFWDASTERLGIGTSSPAYELDVNGTIAADNAIFGTTSDAQTIVYVTSSTTGESEIRLGDTDTDAGSIAYNNSDNSMQFRANAAERMRIDSSGNVGIGTTSPNDKFHVANGSTGAGYLRIANNEGYARLGTDGGNLLLDVGGSEKSRIDSSGRVGIGTSNPNSALHVVSSNNFLQQLLRLESSSGERAFIGTNLQDNAYLQLYDGSGNLKTVFSTDGNDSYIDGGGNFGIGTDNPATELDVNGTITADNVKLDNTNLQPSYNYTQQQFQGYQALGNSTQTQIGPTIYLRNYNDSFYKRYIEVVNDVSYAGLSAINDLNIRLSLYVPTGTSAVNIGTVDSITTTGQYNRSINIVGDVTHWFSDYSGVGANSNGASAFPSIVSSSYDPSTDKTIINASVYNATIPSVGDSIYVHPFDWENANTELIGVTRALDGYFPYNGAAKSILTKVYLGNIDRVTACALKLYESTTGDNVVLSRSRVYQTDERA